MANFVALMVAASAVPAMIPLTDRYPTNPIRIAVRTEVTTHLIMPATRLRPSLPKAALAIQAAR